MGFGFRSVMVIDVLVRAEFAGVACMGECWELIGMNDFIWVAPLGIQFDFLGLMDSMMFDSSARRFS